uniref:Uncharacterized protein n=1 Tax=Rice gall dwarf virus TaxID=10986 RepID=A5X2X6_RGDV|nr:unknown [Rice gall dwarf virus]
MSKGMETVTSLVSGPPNNLKKGGNRNVPVAGTSGTIRPYSSIVSGNSASGSAPVRVSAPGPPAVRPVSRPFTAPHTLHFPKGCWNIVTFNSSDAETNRLVDLCITDVIKDHALTAKVDNMRFELDENDLKKLSAPVREKLTNIGIIDPANNDSAELSGLVVVKTKLDSVIYPNTMFLPGGVGFLASLPDVSGYFAEVLERMPVQTLNSSLYYERTWIDGMFEKFGKNFASNEHGKRNKTLTSVLRDITTLADQGVTVACPIHSDVMLRSLSPSDPVYYAKGDQGCFKSHRMVFTKAPVSKCGICSILKMALASSMNVDWRSQVNIHPARLMSTAYRYVATVAIAHYGKNRLAESNIRSTDHATVVNMIVDMVSKSTELTALGVAVANVNVRSRYRRAIRIPVGESYHICVTAITTLLARCFGELNEWGYLGVDLISQNGRVQIRTGLDVVNCSLVAGVPVTKKWNTASAMDNILEMKTITYPIYNDAVVETFETLLAHQFEREINAAVARDDCVNIKKNGEDERYNFKAKSPEIIYRSIRQMVKAGTSMTKMMGEAIGRLVSSERTEGMRSVNSIAISIIVKMRMEKSKDKSKTQITSGEEKKLPPLFLITPQYEINLAEIRKAVERSSKDFVPIKMEKTAEETSKDIENHVLQSLNAQASMSWADEMEMLDDEEKQKQELDAKSDDVEESSVEGEEDDDGSSVSEETDTYSNDNAVAASPTKDE